MFSMRPGTDWSTLVALLQDPSIGHTHPPLFLLLMARWYSWMPPQWSTLAWDLRVVPAALGVVSVVAMYGLLRAAFPSRPSAAPLGAAAMAVSPLMLLISQEARNYTLPTLLLILALWTMILIARAFVRGRNGGAALWIAWVMLNAAGCYTHYHFMLATAAQAGAFGVVFLARPRTAPSLSSWAALCFSSAAIVLLFAPWIPTLIRHIDNPILRWMDLSDAAGFANDIASGPVVMVVAGPGFSRPLWLIVIWTALSVSFALLVIAAIWRGLVRLWVDQDSRLGVLVFAVVAGATLLALVGASLAIRENLLISPRYSFVWYPGVCALLAAGLAGLEPVPAHEPLWRRLFDRRVMSTGVVLAGIVSGILINTDLSFEKSFHANRLAENMNRNAAGLVIVGYTHFHEICNALSYLVALDKENPGWRAGQFAFVRRAAPGDQPRGRAGQPDYIWRSIAALPPAAAQPGGVWIVGPGLVDEDFPARLRLPVGGGSTAAPADCALDRSRIFDSANNIRGPSGEWTSRRRLTARGSAEYAYYRCAYGRDATP